jgi:hypothetical protein
MDKDYDSLLIDCDKYKQESITYRMELNDSVERLRATNKARNELEDEVERLK